MLCFFFKQKTAYEMRISDWSSDVCSSDLAGVEREFRVPAQGVGRHRDRLAGIGLIRMQHVQAQRLAEAELAAGGEHEQHAFLRLQHGAELELRRARGGAQVRGLELAGALHVVGRSEEHTAELRAVMRS